MRIEWFKSISVLSVASLAVLTGCHDCDDECDKPKHDCDGERVSVVSHSEVRSVNASDVVVERYTWNDEDHYWRLNYTTRPYYSKELGYDEFAPAYRYGFDKHGNYRGQRFDDVEKDLAREWNDSRGTSRLTWDQARLAVRDSWDRDEIRVGVDTTRPSWDSDDQYWRTNHVKRPYFVTGESYDDYSPAYRYGYESRAKFHGKRFDDVEADLSRDWVLARGKSKLEWEKAKAATRDSWDRDEARLQLRSGVNVDKTRVGFDADDQYWRTNYSTRPYFSTGSTYDDYSPAYRYGYESRTKYQGKTFEDVEQDLSRGWANVKATSKLEWEKAKAASRDAWDRADHAIKNDRR